MPLFYFSVVLIDALAACGTHGAIHQLVWLAQRTPSLSFMPTSHVHIALASAALTAQPSVLLIHHLVDAAAAAQVPVLRRTLFLTASTVVRRYLIEAEALVAAGKIPRRAVIDHQDGIAKVNLLLTLC